MLPYVEPFVHQGALARVGSLTALVLAGGASFFAVAYLVGALDKDLLAQLRRRRPKQATDLAE
jgi:putative peptidoglycan lipid II flippase